MSTNITGMFKNSSFTSILEIKKKLCLRLNSKGSDFNSGVSKPSVIFMLHYLNSSQLYTNLNFGQKVLSESIANIFVG